MQQTLMGPSVAQYLVGNIGTRERPGFLQPIRLGDEVLDNSHPALRAAHVAEATNGVRIRFRASLSALELNLQLVTSERTEMALRAGATAPPVVDLLIDGNLFDRRVLEHSELAQRLKFAELGELGTRVFELWLPHNVGTKILSIGLDGSLEQIDDTRPKWIFHGSSITHDALAPGPSETWPARLAEQQSWQMVQLGFRGECHLDTAVARAIASQSCAGIILELGINIHNFQTYRERTLLSAVMGFLQTIRDKQPKAPIVIISPVFGAEREFETSSKTLSGELLVGDLTLPMIRSAIKAAVQKLSDFGDSSIFYVDGLELLSDLDAHHFPDGLHPNYAGTDLIISRLSSKLETFFN